MNTTPRAIYIQDEANFPQIADMIARIIGVQEPTNPALRTDAGLVQNQVRIKIVSAANLTKDQLEQNSLVILNADAPFSTNLTQKADAVGSCVVLLTSDRSPAAITIGQEEVGALDEWGGDSWNTTFVYKFRAYYSTTFQELRKLLRSGASETDSVSS